MTGCHGRYRDMDDDFRLARRLARNWRKDPNWVIQNPKNYVGAALHRCVDADHARQVLNLAQIELTGFEPQPPGLVKALRTVGAAKIPSLAELIFTAKNLVGSDEHGE